MQLLTRWEAAARKGRHEERGGPLCSAYGSPPGKPKMPRRRFLEGRWEGSKRVVRNFNRLNRRGESKASKQRAMDTQRSSAYPTASRIAVGQT